MGKAMSSTVEGLFDQTLEGVKTDIDLDREIKAMMKVSDPGFEVWDND